MPNILYEDRLPPVPPCTPHRLSPEFWERVASGCIESMPVRYPVHAYTPPSLYGCRLPPPTEIYNAHFAGDPLDEVCVIEVRWFFPQDEETEHLANLARLELERRVKETLEALAETAYRLDGQEPESIPVEPGSVFSCQISQEASCE